MYKITRSHGAYPQVFKHIILANPRHQNCLDDQWVITNPNISIQLVPRGEQGGGSFRGEKGLHGLVFSPQCIIPFIKIGETTHWSNRSPFPNKAQQWDDQSEPGGFRRRSTQRDPSLRVGRDGWRWCGNLTASRDFCREGAGDINRGIVVKRTLRQKKKPKSLQDGLVLIIYNYIYGFVGSVSFLCGGMFFSGSFINDWIIFLLRCPNPKKTSWRCVEMDPKHLTPKKELFRDWILFQYFDYYSLKRGMYGHLCDNGWCLMTKMTDIADDWWCKCLMIEWWLILMMVGVWWLMLKMIDDEWWV